MKRLSLILALFCGSLSAQTFYTDCAGIAGTSLSGTVACANLPNGYTTAFNPKAVINWTYPSQPSAIQFTVTAGSNAATNGTNLQNAINTAAANCGSNGYIINVPVGHIYTAQTSAPNGFNFPQNNCTAGHYVVLQSASLSSLNPQGTRVKRTDNVNMPTLTNNLGAASSVIFIGDAPNAPPAHYWFSGLEIVGGVPCGGCSAPAFAYITIGDACSLASGSGCPITSSYTSSNFVNDVHLDRIYAHSNNCSGASTDDAVNFGIAATDGWNVSMSDSIVDCVIDTSTASKQSEGWEADQTPGPMALVNNEIRALTEGVTFGFTRSAASGNIIPSDLYVGGNYIHKFNTSYWAGLGNQRNWIECKACQRLLIEGNWFDTNRGTSQSSALQFTPRNAAGTFTWATVTDVVIRYNHMQNLSDFIDVFGPENDGLNSLGPLLPSKRFNVHDNVVENFDKSVYGGNGRWIQIIDGNNTSVAHDCSSTGNACLVSDIVITHNTFAGGSGTSQTNTFFTLGGTPAAGGQGFNIVITNNIAPAGLNGFASDTGTPHPLTGFLNAQFTSYTFDNNVITGISGAGYGVNDFPSPICNFSNSSGAPNNCSASNPGFQSSMTGIGFTNYNSGSGGDYHLCFASGVPAGCTTNSAYQDLASDSFNDNTKEGPSPGANIDAVNQMTACALTGNCTIQPFRAYGPVKGQEQEMRQWVKFPGYYDAAVADGSGNANFLSFNSGGDPESWSGISIFHDLQHDPGGLINLSGANVGLKGNDYTLSTGSVCGLSSGAHITDSKAFWGQVTLQSVNNVRAIYKYRGPLIDNNNNHANACGNTSIMWNYLWTMARPGFVNTRFSFDNGSGSSITFSPFQPRMSTSTYTFNQIAEANKYPPSYGTGWSDNAWQVTHCQGTVPPADYDPGSGIPWGFLGATGWMMHSITSTTTNGGGFVGGITDGYTTLCNGDTKHYPITAEFLNIENDNSGAVNSSNYQEQAAGGGVRSSLNSSATIGTSPTVDTLVQRSCGWYGDLAIRNSTNATELAAECHTPVNPTMNAGTSPAWDPNYGCWDMTADSIPHVDFTLNHTWTSPVLCITGWNGSAPNVSVNGVAQTANTNFVYSTNDGSGDPISNGSTGLLVQFVGLPSNGSGGMVALPSSTRIVITAGTLSPQASPYIGHQTIYIKGPNR